MDSDLCKCGRLKLGDGWRLPMSPAPRLVRMGSPVGPTSSIAGRELAPGAGRGRGESAGCWSCKLCCIPPRLLFDRGRPLVSGLRCAWSRKKTGPALSTVEATSANGSFARRCGLKVRGRARLTPKLPRREDLCYSKRASHSTTRKLGCIVCFHQRKALKTSRPEF